ncbi:MULTISPECIES: GNAT family N-acetyltransferase [unclassified Rhizobium]|uniref:GNAT family N-acetyltransferase n=1 Tax=unclassified Rhizobium TaxID=2613769 RepID=UPI000CDF3EB9|nr:MULTISPECIES: GNAT family N-acetyltransferase [unclassified Rhizobium]AVA25856.1 GCN5-related N-acetyltransferase protein [Rhizobium sp. NXC24]MDK4741232.1 GNAT family N-acetyltransferase [Rhizobium sp. CNPSo 3464]
MISLADLPVFEAEHEGYTLSTDRARLDVDRIHRYLSEESYWARGLDRALLERALAGSLPVAIYAPNGDFAAFARVVTDLAIFAYLRDVFTLPDHRGRGLATFLTAVIQSHPELKTVSNWMLATRDAHAVYAKAGFAPVPHPEYYMSIRKPTESP